MGVAGDESRGRDVRWSSGSGGVIFAFTEYAFKRGAGEPDEVAACVHVKRDGLSWVGAEREGESVVATGRERERDLAAVEVAMVVVTKPGGGTNRGRFQEVVGIVELGL